MILSKALTSWRSLPEPIRFAVIERLRSAVGRATWNAGADSGFASAWRAEAKGLRAAIRLLKAAEPKKPKRGKR